MKENSRRKDETLDDRKMRSEGEEIRWHSVKESKQCSRIYKRMRCARSG